MEYYFYIMVIYATEITSDKITSDNPLHQRLYRAYVEALPFVTIISFQVIEHIKDDVLFIKEIYRLLRSGGKALVTTPNILMTLTRNPWHIREYTSESLLKIALKSFNHVEIRGITGNDKVMSYYDDNKKSVQKFKKLDIFNLEKMLPAGLYKIPYEILNRLNRNKLKNQNNALVSSISVDDYFLQKDDSNNLDLFLILKK